MPDEWVLFVGGADQGGGAGGREGDQSGWRSRQWSWEVREERWPGVGTGSVSAPPPLIVVWPSAKYSVV